jgi:hypothetical protein
MTPRAHPNNASRVALAIALGLAVAGSARRARAEEVGRTVADVLGERRYRFCHEEDYPLAPDEHAWCAIVGEASGACPSLPRACRLPPVERAVSSPFATGGRHGRRAKGDKATERAEQPDARRRPPDCKGSVSELASMSGAAQVVFVAMILIFALGIARLIAKNLLKGRAPEAPPPPDAKGDDPATAPAVRGPVETDVDRLLARAREAAARGDYARAVDDAYAALLRRLDGDGRIEIHPSRTNGDYVRALGSERELRAAVRAIVRDVESVQFGATLPSETVFQSVLARVLPIATRVSAVLLLMLGLGSSVSCGDGDDSEDAGYGDTSPSGTQALVDVMGRHGVKVAHRTETLATLEDRRAVVLLPDAMLDDAIWKHLLSWVRDKGGTLVIAGVTGLPPEVEQVIVTDGVADAGEGASLSPAPGVRWVGHASVSLPPGYRVEQAALAADGGEGGALGPRVVEGSVLRRGERVVVTERRVGDGRLVLVADERLFTNVALVADEDATFVLSLLYRSSSAPEHQVDLCDGFTGAGSSTPLEAVDRAHLTPFLLQLFALVGLLFLWKGVAFARLRDPPAETRRAFVDHVRALGLSYRRAKATRHVAGLYAVWALERLRERVHRSGRAGLIPLAEAIAARTGRTEADVMRVLVDAAALRDEAAPPSSVRAAAAAPGAAPRRAGKAEDTAAKDLALMHELASFLAATGSSPAAPRSPS